MRTKDIPSDNLGDTSRPEKIRKIIEDLAVAYGSDEFNREHVTNMRRNVMWRFWDRLAQLTKEDKGAT